MDKALANKKIGWIEALRAVALLMVVIPHFIAGFCPQAFVAWETYSWALRGINGKHGVAIFCVLIGFFSSRKIEKSLPTYAVQRYLQFFINVFFVLVPCVFVFYKNGIIRNVLFAFTEAAFFRSDLIATFWCVRAMFEGSLICFVLGNYCDIENKPLGFVFVSVVCLMTLVLEDVWVSVCVMGAALRSFQKIKILGKAKVVICVVAVCIIPLLYRHPESTKTYLMQGCSTCLFVYVCSCISELRWIKNLKGLVVLPFIGNISFYMFLWHTPINMALRNIQYEGLNMYLLFAVSFVVSMLLAIIQYWINNRWINPLIKNIQIKIRRTPE